MEYYLLPVEKNESLVIEEALRKVNYDVDDRSSYWKDEDIDKIVQTMTKDNAHKLIIEFLPEPISDKFAKLFGIKIDE